ncbi:energy transducer TonB [Mucilaginibacter sp. FT3.2]|uniref:energy transducer TonB n=1 Tax=Mucilaginibacter sp. FT3.2 TaxID=2723090 RepID=UPI00160AF38D|nr:energy transducer TonB [Mucilaginibacter sp. FT3.2]MBB6235162.1 TonB family protein [Mucilaginibacter sp. FT3.2]
MKLPLTFVLLFITSLCFAQRQNVYFLKYNGKYVDVRDSADYIRIVREPDSGSVYYNIFEFYTNGKKKLIGKSISIDPPKFVDQCVSYYANGFKQWIGNYKNGLKAGDETNFYPNGKVYQQLSYPENSGLPNEVRDDYLITANLDSLGNAQVTDGNGYYKGYDDKFKYINEEGNVKNGKRDGQWKGEFKNLHTSFTETYNNGIFINGTATTEEGKVTTYFKSREVLPQFKGGVEGFTHYLSNNIIYPDIARERNIQGRVILSFVVEKDGTLSDIKVSKSVAPILDEEAIRVIKKSPKWIPGTSLGSPVRVHYSVPVSFALSAN